MFSTLEHQIQLFRQSLLYDEESTLNIDVRRKCLLQDALKEGKKKKFDTKKRLEV